METAKRIWDNLQRLALIGLAVYAAIYTHLYNREREARELGEIAAKGLPPDLLAKYTLENRKLVQMVRDLDGKVRVLSRYVPSEGSVQVLVKKQEEALAKYNALLEALKQAKTPEEAKKIEDELKEAADDANKPPEVVVKDWGLTSRFGAGLVFSPGLNTDFLRGDGSRLSLPLAPALDWKWFFWRRYSAILQLNAGYVGPGLTRHVDDFTPKWLHADNVEVGITGGIGWDGGKRIGLTLRSNF